MDKCNFAAQHNGDHGIHTTSYLSTFQKQSIVIKKGPKHNSIIIGLRIFPYLLGCKQHYSIISNKNDLFIIETKSQINVENKIL